MQIGNQIRVSTGIMTVRNIVKRGNKMFAIVSYKSEINPVYNQEALELSETHYNQLKNIYSNKKQ